MKYNFNSTFQAYLRNIKNTLPKQYYEMRHRAYLYLEKKYPDNLNFIDFLNEYFIVDNQCNYQIIIHRNNKTF